MIETEIKFKIDDFNSMRQRIEALGAVFMGSKFQRTLRLATPTNELEKEGVYLRLRSDTTKGSITATMTVKRKISDNKEVKEREEFEITVSDIDTAEKMLGALGFTCKRMMEKNRFTWRYNDTEIVIDELPFGLYLEIEGEQDKIFDTAKKLGFNLDDKIIKTYWRIFKEMGNDDEGDIIFDKDYKFLTRISRR